MSVITAVHEPAVRFLSEAAASLARQQTPVNWIISYDGTTVPDHVGELVAELRTTVPETRVIPSGAAARQSTARTVALSYVDTPWCAVLDADDTWLPGGLDALLDAAEAADVAWCAGLSVDVRGGTHISFPDYLTTGLQHPGTVQDAYVRLGFLPFHGCATVWRTEVLWEVGGWPALPAAEDTALTLTVSELHTGYYRGGEPAYGYRKYDAQTTADPQYPDRRRIAIRWHQQRVAAIRNARLAPVPR